MVQVKSRSFAKSQSGGWQSLTSKAVPKKEPPSSQALMYGQAVTGVTPTPLEILSDRAISALRYPSGAQIKHSTNQDLNSASVQVLVMVISSSSSMNSSKRWLSL